MKAPDQNPQLLPCPFCGVSSAACFPDHEGMMKNIWKVKCRECGGSSGYANDKNTAIELWNTRTVSPDVKILREKIRICLGRLGHMHNKETHENWYFMESLKDLREIVAATAEKDG